MPHLVRAVTGPYPLDTEGSFPPSSGLSAIFICYRHTYAYTRDMGKRFRTELKRNSRFYWQKVDFVSYYVNTSIAQLEASPVLSST